MEVEFTNEEDLDNQLTTLGDVIDNSNTDLKEYVVNYVGSKLSPEKDEVTVGMIVEVFAKDFPELIFAVAEENWIRGYEQAMSDVDEGKRLIKEAKSKKNESEK